MAIHFRLMRPRLRRLVDCTCAVSGLMGLGWQALSSSGAKPLWQALYEDNVLDEPLMAFYLTRFQNVSKAQSQEPGGVFTIGLSKCHTANFPSLSCFHVRRDK